MQSKLIDIVKEVSPIFIEGYSAVKEISFKSEIDLVTQYDLKVEELLKERLAKAYPDHIIVGEETSEDMAYGKKAIYVDPIDGTTNFVHSIPFCAMSVGIWEEGVPVEGVVFNPIMDELYYAKKGEGAFLNGEPIHVSKTNTLQKSLVSTGFPYTKIEKGRDYEWVIECMQAVLPKSRDIRRLGSAAIDLCFVARGVYDCYYEVNLKPWDVAAGILVLLEAGGAVTVEDGSVYSLEDRVIVASNGVVHDSLCEVLPKLKVR